MGKDVIIACDFASAEETFEFLSKFQEERPFVKIGMELFYAEGPQIVKRLKARGHKVFLDLKLHDIPNTVKKTMKVLSSLDVDMCNLHAAGTRAMMEAAIEGLTREDGSRPLLIAVTQLTSTGEEQMQKELLIGKSLPETVMHYAENAKAAGLDGVVCSPLEAGSVHECCGESFVTVTPGVRFADAGKDDQTRITTPAGAKEMGSDYIVVGRPITRADDPVEAYRRCVREFVGEDALKTGEKASAATADTSAKSMYAKKAASGLLSIGAVFFRPNDPFTWASGIKSPVYCDNRLILTAPKVRDVVEDGLAELVKTYYPEAEVLMGTSTAGIAHAAIVGEKLNLPMGYVRSGAKDHGRQNRIEGKLEKGQKVVVIEDLISTGGSVIEVVDALREEGAEVLGIVSIFTYNLAKGLQRLKEANVKNVSLTNIDEVAKIAAETGYIREDEIETIISFRNSL